MSQVLDFNFVKEAETCHCVIIIQEIDFRIFSVLDQDLLNSSELFNHQAKGRFHTLLKIQLLVCRSYILLANEFQDPNSSYWDLNILISNNPPGGNDKILNGPFIQKNKYIFRIWNVNFGFLLCLKDRYSKWR